MPFDNNDTISNPSGSTPPPAPAPTDQQNTVTPSTQDSSAQTQTAPQFQSPASAATAAPQQSQQQNSQKPPILSNAPAQDDSYADHPAVKKAGLLRSIAETLAGGPRTSVRYDENGNRVVTRMPLGGREIGWAIAMEALSGGLSGLAAGRGRGPGAAGVAGMQSVIGQRAAGAATPRRIGAAGISKPLQRSRTASVCIRGKFENQGFGSGGGG